MTEPIPLRLAVGSHKRGSGKGCAMNVISWESGDVEITDYPECADKALARMVQMVNDGYCAHLNNNLLCPPCSEKVLDLGHRIVGTGWLDRQQRARAWVGILIEMTRPEIADLTGRELARANDFLLIAERYIDGTADPTEVAGMHRLVQGGSGPGRRIEWAMSIAVTGLVSAGVGTSMLAGATGVDDRAALLARAHHVVDLYEKYAEHVATRPAQHLVDRAVTAMREVAPR